MTIDEIIQKVIDKNAWLYYRDKDLQGKENIQYHIVSPNFENFIIDLKLAIYKAVEEEIIQVEGYEDNNIVNRQDIISSLKKLFEVGDE